MRRMVMMLSVAALMVALSAGAALASGGLEFRYGTNAGEALYGTPGADAIDALGGADLVYGYGGGDLLLGGNESGWGDKILGGGGRDTLDGQAGDDALYGQAGSDKLVGRAGNDRVVGSLGSDTLNGGPGNDLINARDGEKDTIVFCISEDTVYYDKNLDILRDSCVSPQGTASLSASQEEGALVAKQPPKDLFEHTGKVLVEHKGTEKCVAEKALKGHLKHGDELVNAIGCSSDEQGRH